MANIHSIKTYGETMSNSRPPYELSRWSLGDLFPAYDSEEMKAVFAEVEAKVDEFEAKRPELSQNISSEDFMSLVYQVEEINRMVTRIGAFAGLWYTEDTQNQEAQNFQAQVDQFSAGMQNRMLFFSWRRCVTSSRTPLANQKRKSSISRMSPVLRPLTQSMTPSPTVMFLRYRLMGRRKS
jgi:oligoendopeptidase F